MRWELADGTVVSLGGEVDGDSALAARLRLDAADAKHGAPDLISVGAQPGSWERLDVNNAQLVNIWVRTAADKARIAIISAPEVGPLPADNRAPVASLAGRPPVIY
jgi:hypothetical protein